MASSSDQSQEDDFISSGGMEVSSTTSTTPTVNSIQFPPIPRRVAKPNASPNGDMVGNTNTWMCFDVNESSKESRSSHNVSIISQSPLIVLVKSCDGSSLIPKHYRNNSVIISTSCLTPPNSSRGNFQNSNDEEVDSFLDSGGGGSSSRRKKRKFRDMSYADVNSDDDEFLKSLQDTDSDEGVSAKNESMSSSPAIGIDASLLAQQGNVSPVPPLSRQDSMAAVDSPPPGHLASLWYSQELFLDTFIIDKILAWKSRSKPNVEPEGNDTMLTLDNALKTQDKLLKFFGSSQKKLMDISRINVLRCPTIVDVLKKNDTADDSAKIQPSDREEVLLIKWRGRSYRHSSWERSVDLIRLDPTNNTAKGKIKRFVASQELILGRDWKMTLEKSRRGIIDKASESESAGKLADNDDDYGDEEYFPPDFLEVEKIVACDESEMDMDVLAKQRTLNLLAQRDNQDGFVIRSSVESSVGEKSEMDEAWDPEDNVRYVVKWKGLPMSEINWEYWRDIKGDSVDEAEDFWYRQRIPSESELRGVSHPHVREFKKITESPLFGISQKPRPTGGMGSTCADFGGEAEEGSEGIALELRSYQLEGLNWLLWNWWNRRSCILADEMGLGKTIQTVCFLYLLSQLKETQVRGPFMVIAPLSLISQWQSETIAWAPDMNCLLYHGSADARAYMVEHEFYFTEPFVTKTAALKLKRQNVTQFQILITTYEVAMKDLSLLSKIRWSVMIVDEAHRLKNAKSRLFDDLSSVPRDFCLLLTGTPLQNSTEELWALLNFADKINFLSKGGFVEKFGQLTSSTQVSDLHATLKPYLLRRVKEDVAKALPPKEETILEVSLTPIQKTFYKAIYERNTAFLFKGTKPNNAPSLMNIMMELRKCCNHPFLIRGAEERIIADAAVLKSKEQGEYETPNMSVIVGDQLVKSSGKMVLLAKLLPKLYSGGHKVLIFSQMVRNLDILSDFLRIKQYKFERLDGSISAAARVAAVDRFHRRTFQRFVMLLSTRAGGLGLNLTAADTVIIFDSDWNPQNDLQAMARAHRIGQTRAVRVYRLLTAKTYEMHMFHSASLKLGLDRAVLAHQRHSENADGAEGDEASNKKKSKADRESQAREIDQLLKKGAYDVFRDEDDEEAQKFMETDIDLFLERSSRTVTYGNDAANAISAGLGSFSKASFVASSGDGEGKDVDLDDPDFWKKAVGFEEPPDSMLSSDAEAALLAYSDKKRNRKQVQMYDPYAHFGDDETKKKERIAAKTKLEKCETDRPRDEKKRALFENTERFNGDDDNNFSKLNTQSSNDSSDERDCDKSFESKRFRKNLREQQKLYRAQLREASRAENENPVFERIISAWGISQRASVVNCLLKYGFSRFLKVRSEANLNAVPVQDIEVFVRYFLFLLGLQASAFLLSKYLHLPNDSDVHHRTLCVSEIDAVIPKLSSTTEREWVCSAVCNSLELYRQAVSGKRRLRLAKVLTDKEFLSNLRTSLGARHLFRLAQMTRVNNVMEKALDNILEGKIFADNFLLVLVLVQLYFDVEFDLTYSVASTCMPEMKDIGAEELGKRGCSTRKVAELDVDMKAKLVTTEETCHAISQIFRLTSYEMPTWRRPAPWWDHACDVALLVGTFAHGFGCYDAMRRDERLPFGWKSRTYGRENESAMSSIRAFHASINRIRLDWKISIIGCSYHCVKQCASMDTSESGELKSSQEQSDGSEKPSSSTSNVENICLCSLRKMALEAFRNSTSCTREVDVGKHAAAAELQIDEHEAESHLMPDSRVLTNALGRVLALADGFHPPTLSEVVKSERDVGINSMILCDNNMHACNKIESDAALNEYSNGSSNGSTGMPCCHLLSTDRLTIRSCITPGGSHVGNPSSALSDSSFARQSIAEMKLESESKLIAASCLGLPAKLSRCGLAALLFALSSTVQRLGCVDVCYNEQKRTTQSIATSGASSVECDTAIKVDGSITRHRDINGNGTSDAGADVCTSRDSEFRDKAIVFLLEMGSISSPNETTKSVHASVLRLLDSSIDEDFVSHCFFATSAQANGDFAGGNAIDSYFRSCILPECLKNCLFSAVEEENGLRLNGDRDGKPGMSDSLSANPSDDVIMCSLAVLRRYRLMHSVRFILSGRVPASDIMSFLKGPIMRQNLDGLPIWWCPWIHDLALLVTAANRGLLGILSDRVNAKGTECESSLRNGDMTVGILTPADKVFSKKILKNHIRSTFIVGKRSEAAVLPQCYLSGASFVELDDWVQAQSEQFPTAHVLERRIATICANLTKPDYLSKLGIDAADMKDIIYDNVPMLDHGCWPSTAGRGRREEATYVSHRSVFGGKGGTIALSRSLLSVTEQDFS